MTLFGRVLSYFRPLFQAESASNIPALDGVRALAIALVVLDHCSDAISRLPIAHGWIERAASKGWVGVDLFFVLSGFLIGSQLLGEIAGTGRIRYGRFILRRSLRLWPLYYFVLAVMAFLSAPIGWHDLFYWMNYKGGAVTGGWSLATEEQFYLLIPIALIAGLGSRRKPEALWKAGWIALFCAPLIRWWVAKVSGISSSDSAEFVTSIYKPLHAHFDSLVLGLLLAFSRVFAKQFPVRRVWAATVCSMILAVAFPVVFKLSLACLFSGALVHRVLAKPESYLGRIFSWRPFYSLSRLSYGVYLTYNFLVAPVTAFFFEKLGWSSSVALYAAVPLSVLLLSSTLCVGLWAVIEEPFLRLRARLCRDEVRPQAVARPAA